MPAFRQCGSQESAIERLYRVPGVTRKATCQLHKLMSRPGVALAKCHAISFYPFQRVMSHEYHRRNKGNGVRVWSVSTAGGVMESVEDSKNVQSEKERL